MIILFKKILPLCWCLLSFQVFAQSVLDPTRFETAITAFELSDSRSRPPTGAIVLTGSSSIARWNEQSIAALAPLTVIPRGFGGSVMGDVLHYLERVALTYEPRAILIYEGDNDTFFGLDEETIVTQFEKIVAKVHEVLPKTRLYVLSVKPSIARQSVWAAAQQVSQRLYDIATADPLIFYIDVATPFLQDDGNVMTDIFVADQLHLNNKGNEIWGSVIKAALMEVESPFEN